jgi:integration host factor subunit beta
MTKSELIDLIGRKQRHLPAKDVELAVKHINPKTGEAVALSGKHVPHFKPGKDLRERVNAGRDNPIRS